MNLKDWLTAQVEACLYRNETQAIKQLSEASGMSMVTIRSVANGLRLKRHDRAKSLSEATGGVVSIKEICE